MKKRGQKKAQTTTFIIIAIAIIAAIAIFLYFKSSSAETELTKDYFIQHRIEPSINNIQDFVIDCLEINSKDALDVIGVRGGYYNKPEYYYDLDWTFIPYYYYQGQFLMPSKQTIENELSDYINDNLEYCIKDIKFNAFKITFNQPQAQTSINPSYVTFTTTLPLTINHQDQTTTFQLSQHPVTINSSLYEIIEVADYITESHKENPELMCINCITEIANQRKLYVDFIAFEDDSTLVMLLENSTSPEPYIFEFLNKY